MLAFLHVTVARIRGLFRPGDLDGDFDQELATHLAMAEEDKMRQGMTREQARRAARVELGGLTQLREASRAARGLPWLDGFWLDVKLGLRMLRKSWGLTLVGGLAMTCVIGIGAVVFAVFDTFAWGTLPLDDGDRVVAIQTWDAAGNRRHDTSLPDFDRWRDELRSVQDIGAFQTIQRNLVAADGSTELVFVAEMTASGFQLARVRPLLGRPLVQEDERNGALPVVVIGYHVWQSRFASDPAVVGQTVRLGATVHTVVGVMPEGFAFPVNHHFWVPLRTNALADLRHGPEGVVFARLAPGVTLDGAQAEVTTLGLLPPAGVGGSDEQLHPRVVPYTFAFTGDIEPWQIRFILFLVALLLVPPCANIAILVYARTVGRQEEFAARHALGASRGRIVVQIFVETLVLAAGAAGVALVLARLALRYLQGAVEQDMGGAGPFWINFSLSSATVLFVAGLAMLAAVIAGLVPALKATGRQMQSGLRALGGRTGMQLGTTWTVLVVAQVAFSLAALPSAVEMAWGTLRPGILGPGFATEEFLTARLMMDRVTPPGAEAEADQLPFTSRFAVLQAELIRKLEAEPGVLEVTVAAAVPNEAPWARVEVDGVPPPRGSDIFESHHLVRSLPVDDVFFDVFGIPLLAGRGFEAGDFEPGRTSVIVTRAFAQRIGGDGNPLGRRVRYIGAGNTAARESERWHEIVGVVGDLFSNARQGTMYHAAAPGQIHPVSLALRVGPDTASVAGRLREIITSLDPTLRLDEVRSLDEIYRQHQEGNYLGAFALAGVTLSVLLLSAAGMYALMSFTIKQRRREIGIRSALGAQPHRLLAGIFKRALGQLAAGASCGVVAALLLGRYLPIEEMGGLNVPGILPAAAAFMIVVGLFAAAGPARRGLRVEPTEALRGGG